MRSEWLIVPLTLLLLLELQSCSPRIIEHYTTVRDTTYITQIARDSIFERDSIYIREKRCDTVYQAVHDTTTVKEVQLVPRPKGWWDKTKDYAIWVLLAALVFAYRKQILKLLKTL